MEPQPTGAYCSRSTARKPPPELGLASYGWGPVRLRISRVSRWSDAPAIETSVISRLVRLQQGSKSDSGSCGGDTIGGGHVPPVRTER